MRLVGTLGLLVALAWGCAPVHEGGSEPATPPDEVSAIESGLTVCAEGPTVEGIDVSRFQGNIDWKKVAGAGKKFAYIQVGRGLSPDPYFKFNWAQAKANGILRGSYLRFFPDQDVARQAQIVIGGGPYLAGDLPPMLDIEDQAGLSAATLAKRVDDLVSRVEAATGRTPVIYTGYYFWKDSVRSVAFEEHPLFIAHYDVKCPLTPAPWRRWTIHQYTSKGRIAGITANTVDLNRFNGTMQALTSMTLGTMPAPVAGTGTLTGAIYEGGDVAARIVGATVTVNGQSQKTGPEGLYRFELPAGTYTVKVTHEGYRSNVLTRTIEAGTTVWGSMGITRGPDDGTTPIPVDEPAGVTGLVVESLTGARLAGVTLELRDAGGETVTSTQSDAEGRYSLEAPGAPFQGTLIAIADGFAPVSLPVSIDVGSRVVMDVALEAVLPEDEEAGTDPGLTGPGVVTGLETVYGCSSARGLPLWAALGAAGLLLGRRRRVSRTATFER